MYYFSNLKLNQIVLNIIKDTCDISLKSYPVSKVHGLGPSFNPHHSYQRLSRSACAYGPSAEEAKVEGSFDFFGQTVHLNLQSPGIVEDPVLKNKVEN